MNSADGMCPPSGYTEVAVPLSRLADIIVSSKQEAAAMGLNACVKGHVGDGNFHENITYDSTQRGEFEKARSAVRNMVRRATEMEGTCTAEHGIGFVKKDALRQEVGSETLSFMAYSPVYMFMQQYWLAQGVAAQNSLLTQWPINRNSSKDHLTLTGSCMIERPSPGEFVSSNHFLS